MADRLSRHEWAMGLCKVTALRSTCLRRHVGCVLVDQDYFVLATGYNGVPAGMPHCNKSAVKQLEHTRFGLNVVDEIVDVKEYPHACPGARAASGTNLDGCHALHAEWNALLRCGDPRRVFAAFVTSSPCMTCTKMLMNTGCRQIWFDERYAHDEPARELWESSRGSGSWIHATPEFMQQVARSLDQ